MLFHNQSLPRSASLLDPRQKPQGVQHHELHTALPMRVSIEGQPPFMKKWLSAEATRAHGFFTHQDLHQAPIAAGRGSDVARRAKLTAATEMLKTSGTLRCHLGPADAVAVHRTPSGATLDNVLRTSSVLMTPQMTPHHKAAEPQSCQPNTAIPKA